MSEPEIAVLVPCFNESAAIAKVVADFRAALPGATVYVYDNNSTDDTSAVAASAGAEVRRETRRGKGNVVRRMFQDVEADIYVMVDGDDTYDAAVAPGLVDRLIADNLDMVVGKRVETHQAAYRAGLVTNTIVLGRAPADDVRMRVNRTLNHNAAALIVVAAAFWIYDIGLLLTH